MLPDRYLNPLTDFGFKKLFGSEPNKELLIDFLNQLLPEPHKIEKLTYKKNEHLGITEVDRKAIFDLYCENEKGQKFIVELQKAKQNYFKDRSVYYSTFPIQEQAQKGDWDYKLQAIYTVGILDFVFEEDKDCPDVVHKVKLKNQLNKVFFDKLTYIYIELPKFQKTEAELETLFDKWLYVLKHLENLKDRPRALQERVFDRLFLAAEIAKFKPEEREAYEESLKHYRDLKNVIDTSFLEGKEIGIEEGMEKGMEKERQAIAKEMKQAGMDVNAIVKLTKLSIAEIEQL